MTDFREKSTDSLRFSVTSSNRTKAGRLRELIAEIEAAHARGWRYEHIVAKLRDQALDVSVVNLRKMLMRIRREREKSVFLVEAKEAPKEKPLQPTAQDTDKPISENPKKLTVKISSDGYREPLRTFTRDITKRIDLDE
jgi:hypothetical protein